MRKFERVFFWKKMSCNFNEFQYCLCVSSMWKFQSVMFQQIDSRTSCVFSHPGETREKNWSRWKKFNYWPLSSEYLTDLWFQLSRKIENSQTRWHPSHVIQKPKTTLQTWTLRVMCSFRKKIRLLNWIFHFGRKISMIDRAYYVRGKSAHRKWRRWAQEPI